MDRTAGHADPVTAPDWWPDERALAGRENLDVDHVARYDAKMDADAAAEVALLVRLGLDDTATVVELGSGTGQLSLAAAPHAGRVVAVDPSPPMQDHLRTRLAERAVTNVTQVHAGFLGYRHEGPPASFVYSRFALHHLPDVWKAVALRRVHAMLAPGGVLRLWDVVYDLEPDELAGVVEAWLATGGEGVEGEWSREELAEHVRDEHSTFSWLLEPMLARAGFEVLDVERSDDRLESRYVLAAR